jgi:hypothetical protein
METGKVKMHRYNEGEFVLFSTYEAARAKDAALIQKLVNDVRALRDEFYYKGNGYYPTHGIGSLLEAKEAGFTPTEI